MTKNQSRKFFIDLTVRFAVFFTAVTLLLSVVKVILVRVNSKKFDITKFFAPDNASLQYSHILILACIIFVITLISFIAEAMLNKNGTVNKNRNKNRYDELFKRHGIYRKKKMT
jgi:amino acid transporter